MVANVHVLISSLEGLAYHICMKPLYEWILDLYWSFSTHNSYSNELSSIFLMSEIYPAHRAAVTIILLLWQNYKCSSLVPPRDRASDRPQYWELYAKPSLNIRWVGSLTSHLSAVRQSMVYRPYQRRLKSLTTNWANSLQTTRYFIDFLYI